MEQKNKFIYILPVMFGFFIMGFCDLVGISVTYAKEQFQWTETQAGFLPSMVFLWFFILSVPTAMLMNRIGRKNTVLLSMLFTFAGMVLPFITAFSFKKYCSSLVIVVKMLIFVHSDAEAPP